jgi:DNA-directed RNA polymerase specialized sigma24 family protein
MNLAIAISPVGFHSSDETLLAALSSGDRVALEVLYTRHFDALCKVAAAALPEHMDAEDIVQDIFVSLLEVGAPTFDPGRGKALPWLKGVVRREVAARYTPPPRVAARAIRGAP